MFFLLWQVFCRYCYIPKSQTQRLWGLPAIKGKRKEKWEIVLCYLVRNISTISIMPFFHIAWKLKDWNLLLSRKFILYRITKNIKFHSSSHGNTIYLVINITNFMCWYYFISQNDTEKTVEIIYCQKIHFPSQ